MVFGKECAIQACRQCAQALAVVLVCAVLAPAVAPANPWNGKVVFQAFWWDLENPELSPELVHLPRQAGAAPARVGLRRHADTVARKGSERRLLHGL
jgi:hypothetical protein